jgi:hypothetical protein
MAHMYNWFGNEDPNSDVTQDGGSGNTAGAPWNAVKLIIGESIEFVGTVHGSKSMGMSDSKVMLPRTRM